jgi:Aminotransferase class-V
LNALADYRDLWDAQPGWLNTASYGLPPRPAWDALQEALTQWRHGSTSWAPWDASTGRARRAFARLVHADPDAIAVGSTVSGMLSVVAAGLPTGSRVLVPEIEFTSNLFPWLVQGDRGVEVETVPLAQLTAAITPATTVVAFSLVQSATGEVAPYEDIVEAARSVGALVVVDGSQAVGWLPVDATRFDVLACAAYKWLLAPRGAALCYLAPALRDRLRPIAAGWYAARTWVRPTTGHRCGLPAPREGSTRPRRGSPTWARRRPSNCSTRSASTGSRSTTSAWPTVSSAAWTCHRATVPSCRSRCQVTRPVLRRASRRPVSVSASAPAGSVPRFTCTPPSRTSISPWARCAQGHGGHRVGASTEGLTRSDVAPFAR